MISNWLKNHNPLLTLLFNTFH